MQAHKYYDIHQKKVFKERGKRMGSVFWAGWWDTEQKRHSQQELTLIIIHVSFSETL